MNVPPSPAGLHSHCPCPISAGAQLPPLHASSRYNTTHALRYVILKRSFYVRLQHSGEENKNNRVSLFTDRRHCCYMITVRNGCIGCRSRPCCVTLLVLGLGLGLRLETNPNPSNCMLLCAVCHAENGLQRSH